MGPHWVWEVSRRASLQTPGEGLEAQVSWIWL